MSQAIKKLQLTYEYPHVKWGVLHIFKGIHDYLSKDYEIEFFNNALASNREACGPNSPHSMIIKNPENNKFIAVSYHDRTADLQEKGNGWDVDNMVQLVSTANNHLAKNVTPFSYIPYSIEHESIIEEIYTKASTSRKMIFRGYLYDFRDYIRGNCPIYQSIEERKMLRDYLEEIKTCKIGLSLNGGGEICHRDLEILGLQVPLFRPFLKSTMHEPLKPFEHYIAFDLGRNHEETFRNMIQTYYRVIDDNTLLNEIMHNGRKWYERNGTVAKNIEIATKILDIKKLFE